MDLDTVAIAESRDRPLHSSPSLSLGILTFCLRVSLSFIRQIAPGPWLSSAVEAPRPPSGSLYPILPPSTCRARQSLPTCGLRRRWLTSSVMALRRRDCTCAPTDS